MSMYPWDPSRQDNGPVPPQPTPSPAADPTSQYPPPAGWQVPPGAWAPPPRRPSRFALDGAVVRDGLIAGAAAAAVALVMAFVVAAVIVAVADSATSSSGLPGVGHLGAWIDGLAFGAPLVLHAGGSASILGSGSFDASVHVPVPLILTLACVLAAGLTVRSQRARPVADPAAVVAASGCAAIVPFIVGLIVSLASTVSMASAASTGPTPVSGGVNVGVAHFRGAFYPALIIFLVCLGARLMAGGVRIPVALQRLEVGGAARAVGDYLLLTAAMTTVVALVAGLAGLSSAGAFLGLWVLTVPGLGVLGTQLAAFGPLEIRGSLAGGLSSGGVLPGSSGSAAGSRSFSLLGQYVSGWWALLLLIPILGIAIAGVRHALGRPPTVRAPWAAAGMTAGALLLTLFVLDQYLSLGGSAAGQASTSLLGGGSGFGSFAVGIGPLGYLSAAVVGALIPLVGWLLAPVLYRRAPALLRAVLHVPVPARVALAALGQSPAAPATAGRATPWQAPDGPYGPGDPAAPSTFAYGGVQHASFPARPGFAQHQPPIPVSPSGERRRFPVLITAVLVSAIVGASVAVLVVGRLSTHTAATLAGQGAAVTSTVAPSTPPASSSDSATEEPTVPSVTTSDTPAFPTQSPGGINLSEVATVAVTPEVADTLDTYFGGINAHDAVQAASAFDPSGAINPYDSAQVAQFQHDISTTTDDQVAIHGIEPDTANAGGYLVAVTFRSQQDPAFGPGGDEGCTNWDLTYRFTAGYKLLRPEQGASHNAC